MRLVIDTQERTLTGDDGKAIDLYGKAAFELISDLWLKIGWNQKYSYTFTWLGRPIIQHPEDLVRLQEVIYGCKPSAIIETGVAHGGSLVFYASLVKAMGLQSRIIGVDIEIRPSNRRAIEAHELSPYITLMEGDSVAADVLDQVGAAVRGLPKVLVLLDSNHSKAHVARELEAYSSFVTLDSYIVATDGIMQQVHDVPRGQPHWVDDNPTKAAEEFAARHPEFVLDPPRWRFNESELDKTITAWPGAWLRRVR